MTIKSPSGDGLFFVPLCGINHKRYFLCNNFMLNGRVKLN